MFLPALRTPLYRLPKLTTTATTTTTTTTTTICVPFTITRTMKTLTLPTSHSHPLLLYGTAWKKDNTTDLVTTALSAGFQGIDTACQPKHYREDLVGTGIHNSSSVARTSLYIQTKFTSPTGQDAATIPYDPSAPLEQQVTTSIETSLRNLRTDYLDSVLLHSPLRTLGDTVAAWKVLEGFVHQGKIRHLGVSNISFAQLTGFYSQVTTKPAIVQNRFYPAVGWDKEIRAFCKEAGMVYQSFWTLTGNPELLQSKLVGQVAKRLRVGKEEALYALVLSLGRGWEKGGVCVLDGTKTESRMKGDLEVAQRAWEEVTAEEEREFRGLLGEKV